MTQWDGEFETLYRNSDDPYSLRTRWYEARKRALVLASLPKPRYRNAYEPGCGIGALTIELQARCDRLHASDATPRASELTAQHVAAFAQVTVACERLPGEWPDARGPFDLILIAEIGYFLTPEAWRHTTQRARRSLAPGGTLLACDWRAAFRGRTATSEALHAAIDATGLVPTLRVDDADFLLATWSDDPRSVAQHEGIR